MLGFRSSGLYRVDVDGTGPAKPIRVYCDFNDGQQGSQQDGRTVLRHNLRDETVSLHTFSHVFPFSNAFVCLQPVKIVRSPGSSSFYLELDYVDIGRALLNLYRSQFAECEQQITYECLRAPLG